MSPELIEFFNVVLRFAHVVAAIMWIGNSLLFTWMEINFIKDPKKGDDSIGEMNMLHAGGVYFLEKRVLDPQSIPDKLHVFKWQSYHLDQRCPVTDLDLLHTPERCCSTLEE